MKVEEIKQALVELQDYCCHRARCTKCPFGGLDGRSLYRCRLEGAPDEWCIDEWRDDE